MTTPAEIAVEQPKEHRVRANGVELACFEWGADVRGNKPSILMAHATGFHARVWDAVIRRLGPRHIVAVDQRGHGRSENVLFTDWRDVGEDLAQLLDNFEFRDAIGVGHSMGARAMTIAAAVRPDAFSRLLLIDPVILNPEDYATGGWNISIEDGEVHPTARRKSRFDSPQAMIDRFKDRPPYANFQPEALRDYCEYGLLPADDGDGFELACAPATEASVYMSSRSNPEVYESVRAVKAPVMILRAKLPPADRAAMDFSSSPTWPGLAGEFPNGREVFLADRSHFIPMESPDLVATYVNDFEPAT